MSISSAINTTKLGLLAQARAIQVAANSVSNANTPGYFETLELGLGRIEGVFQDLDGTGHRQH